MAGKKGAKGGRVRRAARRITRRVRGAFRGASRSIFQLEAGAAAVLKPLVEPTGTMNGNVFGEVMYAAESGDLNGLTVAVTSFPDAFLAALPSEVEIGAVAVAENWAAKKSGLRNASRVSKKWSIF